MFGRLYRSFHTSATGMDVKDECSGSIDTFLVELRSTCALVSDVCRLLDVYDRLLRSTQSLVHAEWLVTTAAHVARMDSVWTLLGRNEHVLALEEYKIGEYKRVVKYTKTFRHDLGQIHEYLRRTLGQLDLLRKELLSSDGQTAQIDLEYLLLLTNSATAALSHVCDLMESAM